jgi:hypothetical protein
MSSDDTTPPEYICIISPFTKSTPLPTVIAVVETVIVVELVVCVWWLHRKAAVNTPLPLNVEGRVRVIVFPFAVLLYTATPY